MALKLRLGPLLYGLAFTVVLPAALVAWAVAAAPWVRLPAPRSPLAGGAIAGAGLVLLLAGMRALWVHGGGLPMNAYPPPHLVSRGPYRWVDHPIYVGFCGLVLGVAIASGSAAGLWLVFPTTVLGVAALVYGYEAPDLDRRFGARPRPWLALPLPGEGAPSNGERAAVVALVIVPWLAIYAAIASLGSPPDAIPTALPLEAGWPVIEWAEVVYASAYPVVLLAPFLVRTRTDLRTFACQGLLAMALVFPLYLCLPLVAPTRPFVPATALGRLVLWERALDTPACAFPSFHVVWAFISAGALARRTRLAWAWAAAVAWSCGAVGAHTVVDIAGGVLAWILVRHASEIWESVRRGTEAIANSWRDWRVGPLRLIVHGAWAGLATSAGLAIFGAWIGPGSASYLAALWAGGVLGAGAWAQLVEGRSGLSRPFGFYGALAGVLCVELAAPMAGLDTWTVMAAGALCAPVCQGIGRFRCLVQGCCHGAPAPECVGIRYVQPLSRVVKAGLGGIPVHPTPLYSILWNVATALALFRLAALHAPAHLIIGAYFILSGAGRFVEEARRGEPQTPFVLGLRLYQWLAMASVIAGAVITATCVSGPVPEPMLDASSAWVAILCGIGSAAAMGIDFPEARWRLSKLA